MFLDLKDFLFGDGVGVDFAALYGRCPDILAGAGQILQVNVDAPLVYAGTPIRMPGNEIRGFRKGGVLEDIEACNAPLRTRLDYRVAQLSSPDKLFRINA